MAWLPEVSLSHPFLIKDIAFQAGLSVATVDRVLNGREGVRQHTRRRVEQAIAELERQSTQIGLAGRKLTLDLVMEAPARFSGMVRAALEAEMPSLAPAVFRARYHLAEQTGPAAMAALLERIARRGSDGVLLKAPDVPEVAAAVAGLIASGIPVITLVTDLPFSGRTAYVGMDNRAAGETAAYLAGHWLGPQPAQILVTLSSSRFRGEEEREIAFRRAIREHYPHLGLVEISEGFGIDGATGDLVSRALREEPGICAVYSIGGGNRAVLEAFARAKRECRFFLAHDLDGDNLRLLREGRIDIVLHHDLRQDMHAACRQIMIAARLLPSAARPGLTSSVQLVTRYNMPTEPLLVD